MGKKAIIRTLVHNKELFFIRYGGTGEDQILHRTHLDAFLHDGFDKHTIPQSVLKKENKLLIVPDFWIESKTYQFQSRKRSMIAAFVERKLKTDHPGLSDIHLFATAVFSKKKAKDNNLQVFYPGEPEFYQLFKKLNETGLAPQRITTSAFIWEAKLRHLLEDFQEAGVGFIAVIGKISFLYLYDKGRFLFSRDIVVPENTVAPAEEFDALVFEVNQSIYLFSQKAKSDVTHLIVYDQDETLVATLSERLGRSVIDFRKLKGGAPQKRELTSEFGPAGAFNEKDVSYQIEYNYISHKIWQTARDWRPVQAMGIAVGLILFLLLGLGYFYLFKMSQMELLPVDKRGIIGGKTATIILREYNDAVNYLIQAQQRLSTRTAMIYLAEALPENVELTDATITITPSSAMALKCAVSASDMNAFRHTLVKLMENLKVRFEGIKELSLKDIEIQAVEEKNENLTTYQVYKIGFKFNLP
jgi:hypothetical protein